MEEKQKTCLVTGFTSGVGKAIAIGLARRGHRVVGVSRTDARGEATVEEIERTTGHETSFLVCDLDELDNVRALAETIASRYGSLDLVSCNAAVLMPKRLETTSGLELTFAVNYLSHFLLVNLLLPLLRTNEGSRVITVSGWPRVFERMRLDFDNLQLTRGYWPVRAALSAALAKVAMTMTFAEREDHVRFHTFHPGLVETGLAREIPAFLQPIVALGNLFLSKSCPTAIEAALGSAGGSASGMFFSGSKPVRFRPRHLGKAERDRLWEISSDLAGLE